MKLFLRLANTKIILSHVLLALMAFSTSKIKQINRTFNTDNTTYMENIEKELKKRIGTGPFLNNLKVSFETYKDGTAHVAAYFPDYNNLSSVILEVALHGSIPDVIRLLSLKSFNDIEMVTFSRLLELYHEGSAEVYCCIDGLKILNINYTRKGNQVFASDDDGTTHEVDEKLENADDFIRHTQRYFGWYD